MKLRQHIILFSIMFFSCVHERNNPVVYDYVDYSNILTNSSVRDFVIIKDFNADNFHFNALNHSCTQGYDIDGDGIYEGITGEQDCNGFWCEWDGNTCSYLDRDILVVANDEEGILIYEIIDGEINPQEIYYRNLIEYAGGGDLDTEIRSIYYAESHNTLYMLDKFEYIYNLYLPPVLSDYNGFPNEHVCTLPQEQFLEYVQCGSFDHSTKFAVNENNFNTPHQLPFEMFILYKENSNTNGSIPEGEGYSEIRKYWYNNNPNGDDNFSPVCDNVINIDSSCNDGEALIRDSEDYFFCGWDIGLEQCLFTYDEDCWNWESSQYQGINYGELLEEECEEIPGSIWVGIPNSNEVASCYLSSCQENGFYEGINQWCEDKCEESLLSYNVTDLHFDGDYNRLFVSNPSDLHHSVNLYNYDPIGGTVSFKDRMIVDKQINTVISNNNYMVTGMKEGGCYITLLNDNGISDSFIHKLHIGENFSVYDIHYDSENNKLLLSCGTNGVLVYNWDGQSLNASLNSHSLSSYAYTARFYNGKVIIGTENGIEVFNIGD